MFPTKSLRPPKICFQEEQYGAYRIKKYLKEFKEMEKDEKKIEKKEELVLPSKHIAHIVKPLLC